MAHDQEVVGSNLDPYWMDVSKDASYYMKDKLKIKVAKWGTPKKYLKKICIINYNPIIWVIYTGWGNNNENINIDGSK
jgi:hypothetical protein